MQRYPGMIASLQRPATRAALERELARIEALERSDPTWIGATEPAKDTLRTRIRRLDEAGRTRERAIPAMAEEA